MSANRQRNHSKDQRRQPAIRQVNHDMAHTSRQPRATPHNALTVNHMPFLTIFFISVTAGCAALAMKRERARVATIEATKMRWQATDVDELVGGLRQHVASRMLHADVATRVLAAKTGLSRRSARRLLTGA